MSFPRRSLFPFEARQCSTGQCRWLIGSQIGQSLSVWPIVTDVHIAALYRITHRLPLSATDVWGSFSGLPDGCYQSVCRAFYCPKRLYKVPHCKRATIDRLGGGQKAVQLAGGKSLGGVRPMQSPLRRERVCSRYCSSCSCAGSERVLPMVPVM